MKSLTSIIADVNREDGYSFEYTLKSALTSSSTYEDFVVGMPEKHIVHCISQSLQSVSASTTNDLFSNQVWNPVVAAMLKCILDLSHRAPYVATKQQIIPSKKKIASSSPAPPVKTSTPIKSKKVMPLEPKVEPKKKADLKVDSKITDVPQENSIPDTLQRKEIYETIVTPNKVIFSNQIKRGRNKLPVDCKIAGCKTCREHALRLSLTQCKDIKLHGETPCNAIGWYPHVLPGSWAAIKSAHKSGKTISLPAIVDASTAPSLLEEGPSSSQRKRGSESPSGLPAKRSWTLGRLEPTTPESTSTNSPIMWCDQIGE